MQCNYGKISLPRSLCFFGGLGISLPRSLCFFGGLGSSPDAPFQLNRKPQAHGQPLAMHGQADRVPSTYCMHWPPRCGGSAFPKQWGCGLYSMTSGGWMVEPWPVRHPCVAIAADLAPWLREYSFPGVSHQLWSCSPEVKSNGSGVRQTRVPGPGPPLTSWVTRANH